VKAKYKTSCFFCSFNFFTSPSVFQKYFNFNLGSASCPQCSRLNILEILNYPFGDCMRSIDPDHYHNSNLPNYPDQNIY